MSKGDHLGLKGFKNYPPLTRVKKRRNDWREKGPQDKKVMTGPADYIKANDLIQVDVIKLYSRWLAYIDFFPKNNNVNVAIM